jgi:hypothetical protein
MIVYAILAGVLLATETARSEWSVDFSRRTRRSREADMKVNDAAGVDRSPASASRMSAADTDAGDKPETKKGIFDVLFDAGEPIQDIVIMHTDRGFVPATVRVRKGGRYRIHVVNVNEKEKNVSFILDGFSEHHATYYGKIKTFNLEPKKEGSYSFQSPETSTEGKMIVFNPQMGLRAPASAEAGK